jgi:stage II sporulation protein D
MTRTRPLILLGALGAIALAAAAPAVSAPAPAPAAPAGTGTFILTGRGWGHGVGLSQYGARGRSLAGWSAARILAHYYPGTKLGKVPPRRVRVLLATDRRRLAVRSPGPWRALGRRPNGTARAVRLVNGASYSVRALAGGRVALFRGPVRVALFAGTVRLQPTTRGGAVAWGAARADRGPYRGEARVGPSGGRLSLVNVLPLEDYLKGVVPREMPAAWAGESYTAVAAQAVAARSYALSTLSPTATYDVFDDDRSQVYGGVSAEDPRTTRAVVQTRNTVLTYHGAVITAFFFSTSGGRTESAANIFGAGAARPYLVSVPDGYDRISPLHTWPDHPTFSAARLGQLLGVGAPVATFTVTRRGDSPRVLTARVTTAGGRATTFTGTSLRSLLGLRDTWFSVRHIPLTATPPAR